MTLRCDEMNQKIDTIVMMIGKIAGIRGFGSNLFANMMADVLMRR